MTHYSLLGSKTTERIPQFTRAASVQAGKNRCLVKSRINGRKFGVFYFDKYNYYADHPAPPTPNLPTAAEITVAEAYFKKHYIAQTNGHIGIDPILVEVPMTYSNTFGTPAYDSYGILNNQLVALFGATRSLPPNKNVYFCIPKPIIAPPNIEGSPVADYTKYSLYDMQYSQASLTSVRYRLEVHEGIRPNDLFVIGQPDYLTENDTFMMRTDSLGNITNLTDKYPCYPPPYPFFNPLGLGVPISWGTAVIQGSAAPKLQVRLVKDRYDVDTVNGGFYTRRYQEFLDNEWDTKVATDA